MSLVDGQADVLLATLDASEACLRRLAAEALPFDAVLRIERAAARHARHAVDGLRVSGDAALPALMLDFGVIDEATDELLDHAVRSDAEPDLAVGTPREIPPLPAVARADDPASAILEPARAVVAPFDEGPEGTADVSAPLDTDETSRGLGKKHAPVPAKVAQTVKPPAEEPKPARGREVEKGLPTEPLFAKSFSTKADPVPDKGPMAPDAGMPSMDGQPGQGSVDRADPEPEASPMPDPEPPSAGSRDVGDPVPTSSEKRKPVSSEDFSFVSYGDAVDEYEDRPSKSFDDSKSYVAFEEASSEEEGRPEYDPNAGAGYVSFEDFESGFVSYYEEEEYHGDDRSRRVDFEMGGSLVKFDASSGEEAAEEEEPRRPAVWEGPSLVDFRTAEEKEEEQEVYDDSASYVYYGEDDDEGEAPAEDEEGVSMPPDVAESTSQDEEPSFVAYADPVEDEQPSIYPDLLRDDDDEVAPATLEPAFIEDDPPTGATPEFLSDFDMEIAEDDATLVQPVPTAELELLGAAPATGPVDETHEALHEGTAVEVRPRAAAIQLGPDGPVMIGDVEDPALELGDSADYGEHVPDDDHGQGLGIDVVEYEGEIELSPVEDLPELERVPEPTLTAEQVASLLKDADKIASTDMQRAVELYSDALDAQPTSWNSFLLRGKLHLDLGDYARAISDFLRAEELRPVSADVKVAMGDLFFARKDYRKAISYFDAALQMEPEHAMAFCRRGISFYYRKQYQEALEDLGNAKRIDPSIPNIKVYISRAKKRLQGAVP